MSSGMTMFSNEVVGNRFTFAWVSYEDGSSGAREDGRCYASDNEPAHPGAAVRAHGNEVRAVLLNVSQYSSCGRPGGYAGFAAHSLGGEPVAHIVEVVHGCSGRALPIRGHVQRRARTPAKHVHIRVIFRGEKNNSRSKLSGEGRHV